MVLDMDGWMVGGWVNGQDSITSSIGEKLPVPNEKTVFLQSLTIMDE